MDYSKYIEYLKLLISEDNINNKSITGYIKMLDIARVKSEEELKIIEDRVFTINGIVLSDKERIYYELNSLLNNKNIKNNNYLKVIKKIMYKLDKNSIYFSDYSDIKSDIMSIQINNSIDTKFYGTYYYYLNKLFKKEENNIIKKR